jgi:thioredoxin 1
MNKRSVDSYVRFSAYNESDKQNNPTNYSSNYNDLPPSQVPDPTNNRFANPPPQPLDQEEYKQDPRQGPQQGHQQGPQQGPQGQRHRVKEIESAKLHQLLSDPTYHNNQRGPTKIFAKVYTNWCGPCKMIAPKIQQLSLDHKHGDILFVQIDGEKICEKLKKYINVSAVPVFFTFVAGKQFGDFIVGPDHKKIIERLDEMSNL